jgi:hypothetical protein
MSSLLLPDHSRALSSSASSGNPALIALQAGDDTFLRADVDLIHKRCMVDSPTLHKKSARSVVYLGKKFSINPKLSTPK